MFPYEPANAVGYTGPSRRGSSKSFQSLGSNGVTLEDITQPCPTCGQPAVGQTYDSIRPDGVYRVTQLRCPSAKVRRDPKSGFEKANLAKFTCPVHKTEIKIGDTPMPVQKICTVIPKPEDQAEYKRLKAVLGLENQEFVKLCLLTNSPVYDWFAGRAISPQTEAKILFAIKELQKREGKPVVKASNGRQIGEASKEAAPDLQTETQSNSRDCDCSGCITCGNCSACEPETGCGDCNPKRPWEVSKERLQQYTNGNGNAPCAPVGVHSLSTRIANISGRLDVFEADIKSLSETLSENAKARLDNLHTRMGAMCDRIDVAEAEINVLAKSVTHLEEEADAEPEITDELLSSIEFAAPGLAQRVDRLAELVDENEEKQGNEIAGLMHSSIKLHQRVDRLEAAQEKPTVPKTTAEKAQMVIDLMTSMSDKAIDCIIRVVSARKNLVANNQELSKAVAQ